MAQSGVDAPEKLRVFCTAGDNVVDTVLLGQQLQVVGGCWPQERLDLLFRVIHTNSDGALSYEELLAWAVTSERGEWDLGYLPIGDGPHIGVRVTVSPGFKTGAKDRVDLPDAFLASMARSAPVGELAELLCVSLGLQKGSVALMHEGNSLDFEGTLEANGISLPGAMARKKGTKVELVASLVGEPTSAPRLLVQHLQHEDWMKDEVERKQNLEDKERRERERLEEERRRAEKEKLGRVDVEFDDYISEHIGVSAEQQEEIMANKDAKERRTALKHVSPDFHFLAPEPEDVCNAFGKLMGTEFKVLKVFRNQNETLIRRYMRARDLLQEGGAIISHSTGTDMQRKVTGQVPFDFLGPYDSAINELPLWHGTPSADAAGGICSIGFDTNHVTTHVWGHGFYFADNVQTSAGYSRAGFHVNSKYSSCKVMMLCRVLAGRVHKTSSAPNQDQQERLVGDCLGPGGCFGAASKYHSIYGGGYAYVCAHRDQVFPAYVILYS